jgi:hypothetical protein
MRPLIARFEEAIEAPEVLGTYDQESQMFIHQDSGNTLGFTSTETATGGHGDTDSDTD